MEPEWQDSLRGISKIAKSATDWEHQGDINEFLLRSVKLASSIGLIHRGESGDGNDTGFAPGIVEDDPLAPGNSGVQVTPVQGGEIYFMKSSANESIESLKNENPTPNTEDFINRIQRRAMYSIGWPQEMIDASRVGGASVRLIQDLARRTVASRQAIIERRAKLIVSYAIAKAIKLGIIPPSDEWFKWGFTKGAQITVDAGNENKSDLENLKIGTTTMAEICSKRGQDWYEVRSQSQREVQDLIGRARDLAKTNNLPFETCLTLLSQTTPNASPVSTPPAI
jgi:hypothetical protein